MAWDDDHCSQQLLRDGCGKNGRLSATCEKSVPERRPRITTSTSTSSATVGRAERQRCRTALIPVSDEKSPSQLATQRDFLKEVKRWTKYIERSRDVVGGASGDVRDFADTSLGAVHQFDINKRTFLFQPDRKWLEAEARRLQRKLRKLDPLHRWVIVHRYDTGDTDTSWGFLSETQGREA